MDPAQERLVAPILARLWDGRTVLRYNGSDYASLRHGGRILRVDALPEEWYRDREQHELALRVLPLLRSLFADVDIIARSASAAQLASSLSLASGDVLVVSNKAGPHCRTTFEGPRYVQRLYADYSCEHLWAKELNFSSVEERLAHLASCVARDFDHAQVAHLERHLAVPLAASVTPVARGRAGDEHAGALAASLLASLEAAIDDVAHLLMEDGPGSPAATTCLPMATQLRELLEPLRLLHRRLGEVRRGGGGAWRLLPHAALLPLRACCDALRPLAFRLRDDNLHEELVRVRCAAAAPGAAAAVNAAVKSAAAALDSITQQPLPM